LKNFLRKLMKKKKKLFYKNELRTAHRGFIKEYRSLQKDFILIILLYPKTKYDFDIQCFETLQFISQTCILYGDPKFRMALLFEQTIRIDLDYFKHIHVPNDLINNISPDIFQNQTKFNILTKDISTSSKVMLLENQDSIPHQRLRQRIIDDTLDNFNTMKFQKSPFIPDFFDKT